MKTLRAVVSSTLILALALHTSSGAKAADLGTEAQKADGKKLYEKHCNQCHGDKGDGLGPSAQYFKPAPRDFTRGKYKVRSTASGELPLDSDIENAIVLGLAFHSEGAYTVMPPWPNLNKEQVMNLVYYLKSFAPDFADPEYNNPKVIEIPEPLAFTTESINRGREVFEANECIKCHGEQGRGDGRSAPTLKDDWGFHIRAADLTKKWTFRGGNSATEIFRTISTGFNGTPMPAYADSTSVEDRLHLANYILSLSTREAPDYNKPDKPIIVSPNKDAIELGEDIEAARKLFENAPTAYIPIVGQVIEPGRSFYPGVREIEVRAIHHGDEIAVLIEWHDLSAETSGTNGLDLEVPLFEPKALVAQESDENSDPFAEEEDPFAEEESEDPFAEEEDPFAEEEPGAATATSSSTYSDAIAVQIPIELAADSFEKPYLVFGDSKRPVELWFADLAQQEASVFTGKGSDNIKKDEKKSINAISGFNQGRWSTVFKRSRSIENGVSFDEGTFVPVGFSVWDGFEEERGNKRGMTSWFNFYIEPSEKESPIGPMLGYGIGLLLLELLLIKLIRRKHDKAE